MSEGEEVLLIKRGNPVARIVSVERKSSILGTGWHDPNINADIFNRDDWWKPLPDDESAPWHE